MAAASTLAYYDTETITAIKIFIIQAPDRVLWHQQVAFNLVGNFNPNLNLHVIKLKRQKIKL
jgi:hypothetical protein